MDAQDFDRMARVVSGRLPRRTLAGLLGLSSLGAISLTEAKKKKKKKKVKKNDFGCVNVGNFCKNDGQCCSGICQGKKDKKKCQAHDESTCQPGQDSCLGVPVPCTTTTGIPGSCVTTTGKAPYCFIDGNCFACSKDTDCETAFGGALGPGAACIACANCTAQTPQGTACVGKGTPAP